MQLNVPSVLESFIHNLPLEYPTLQKLRTWAQGHFKRHFWQKIIVTQIPTDNTLKVLVCAKPQDSFITNSCRRLIGLLAVRNGSLWEWWMIGKALLSFLTHCYSMYCFMFELWFSIDARKQCQANLSVQHRLYNSWTTLWRHPLVCGLLSCSLEFGFWPSPSCFFGARRDLIWKRG